VTIVVLTTCEVANADLGVPAAPSSVALATAQVANPENRAREGLERRVEYLQSGGGAVRTAAEGRVGARASFGGRRGALRRVVNPALAAVDRSCCRVEYL
jgi:hypothetical protein